MIVCHCMNISDRDIDAAIDWMRAADAATIITPGKVYRALGKSADCGGCMPLFLATMRANANTEVPPHLPRPQPAMPPAAPVAPAATAATGAAASSVPPVAAGGNR